MGMFDTVFAHCPNCNRELEFQSKSGLCELKRYHFTSVPTSIAIDLTGDSQQCDNCGAVVTIKPLNEVSRVEMRTVVNNAKGWD
jgi:uncharacterized protein with PIN domain